MSQLIHRVREKNVNNADRRGVRERPPAERCHLGPRRAEGKYALHRNGGEEKGKEKLYESCRLINGTVVRMFVILPASRSLTINMMMFIHESLKRNF